MMYIRLVCFFFKQKTAYEMRISDWSSDVCSSDLQLAKKCRQPFRRKNEQSPTKNTHTPNIRTETRRPGTSSDMRSTKKILALTFIDTLLSSQRTRKIGRASCRERVCQYVYISVVAVSLKKKNNEKYNKQQP